MRPRSGSFAAGMVVVVLLIATACTGGSSSGASSGPTTTGQSGSASGSHTPACIGCNQDLVVGAQGWPKCLNPVTSCADDEWYRYTVGALVFPRLTQWSNQMDLEPSPLITEVPSQDNGGITSNPFSVTYHLNPDAVWSDGTPITCDDVDFTWKATLNTTGTDATYGYDDAGGAAGVSKVECPDPQTVKLDFNKVFVDWPELFGGVDGFILEKTAFASVPGFPDTPDLKGQMQDTIPFSGGPWQLAQWNADHAALVRNPKYWGDQPSIDQMSIVRISPSDPASALGGGMVDAIFVPRATQAFTAQITGDKRFAEAAGAAQFVDALWLNVANGPLRDPLIRQAIAYAFDRGAVSQGVPGLIQSGAPTNDCGPWVPGQGPWCPATGPFARYGYDASKAMAVLKRAGYNCSAVADGGFCTKGGKPLTVTISTVIGDVQQGTAASLLETSALNAGINVQVKTYPATQLFSDVLPEGRFQIGLYGVPTVDSRSPATPVSPADPSVTYLFASNYIPAQANGYSGGNWVRWRSPSTDELMRRSDVELDPAVRAQEIQAIGRRLAAGLPILPLYSSPNAAAWRTDEIGGVDPKDVSSPYGFYFGVAAWSLQG